MLPAVDDLRVSDRIVIPARDLSWTAARSGGPGGQHVNKTASKVDLRFDLDGTAALSPDAKMRLRTLARGRLDAWGRIAIIAQESRDQLANLGDARDRLAALVRQALIVPKKRRPTKPSRGAKERRLTEKKHRGETKRGRSGRFNE
jgi:ribosome-associated protein